MANFPYSLTPLFSSLKHKKEIKVCIVLMSQIGQAPTPANHNAHHHLSTNGAHPHVIWTSSTSTIKPHTSLHSNVRSRFYEVDSWRYLRYRPVTNLPVDLPPVSSPVLCPPISCRFIQVSYWGVIPPVSTSSCQDTIPQLSTHRPFHLLLRVSYSQIFHLHYSAVIINSVPLY